MLRHEPRTLRSAVGNVVVAGVFAPAWTLFVFYFDASIAKEWLWPGSTPPGRGAAEFLANDGSVLGVVRVLLPLLVINGGVVIAGALVYHASDSLVRFVRGRRAKARAAE